jgi:glycosyltransferase involved in cell wall biosynthesis
MKTDTGLSARKPPLEFCTVISKNYIAQARALAESIGEHHPDSRLHVLLVDRVEGYFDPAAESFTTVLIEDLPIPDLPRFCFQYNVLELNTAAKPYFLSYLLNKTGCQKLVYLDPDILILRQLDELARLLDDYNFVLTPHLLEPYPLDGKRLDEQEILLSGTYNLGFIAIADTAETRRMLQWWEERLYVGCQMNKPRGMFVDQKWMELAPGYFDAVCILREPGYNVAYWNLSSRKVTMARGKFWADGQPLNFFHFSGFKAEKPRVISKHQNRLDMEEVGEAAFLFAYYADRLRRLGNEHASDWPYVYGRFDNGVPINDSARHLYLSMGDQVRRFGNPFLTEGESSFFNWLASGQCGRILPSPEYVHHDFPGKNQRRLAAWASQSRTFLKKQFRRVSPLLGAARQLRKTPEPSLPKPAARTSLAVIRKDGRKASGPFGVNLAGYIESEKGVGEAARAVIRSLEAANIPFVLNNVCDTGSKNLDQRYSRFSQSNPYAVTIVQVNADQAPAFFQSRPADRARKFTVGYWNWELSEFPEAWKGSFAYFDEVWAPSIFTQQSIASASPIPVRYIPFSITVPEGLPTGVGRRRFGLPNDAFLFLFAYDFHSFLERKNPFGLVRAFLKAFDDDPEVGLVLKTMHADDAHEVYRGLLDVCRGRRNIYLLNEVYSRAEALALMRLCDAYASLHRSEGFGLTIAEAMAMGKPVVATNYSANVDFMTAENSLPIRHRLIPIERDHGPYRKGMAWADPDLDHAAQAMRRLIEEPALARRLGAAARADIAHQLSPTAVGERIFSALRCSPVLAAG